MQGILDVFGKLWVGGVHVVNKYNKSSIMLVFISFFKHFFSFLFDLFEPKPENRFLLQWRVRPWPSMAWASPSWRTKWRPAELQPEASLSEEWRRKRKWSDDASDNSTNDASDNASSDLVGHSGVWISQTFCSPPTGRASLKKTIKKKKR